MNGIISKNDALFFDTLEKAYGDPLRGIKGDPVSGVQVKAAIAAFLMQPKAAMTKKIQASGVSTDLAQLTKDAFNVTIQTDNFDMGYERAFRQITLGRGQDSWEIYDVANSLTFQKVEEGQRIEVAGITGTKTSASVDYYGGALGWTDKMIRFRKVSTMIDIAQTFRNKYWSNKADNHYALLAAAATGVTAYAGVAADGQLQRDIQTINRAIFTIGDRLKDKGYGDTASANYLLYYNPFDKARILAALNATTGMMQAISSAGRTGQVVHYNITAIPTFNSNVVAGSPIACLPGQKTQKADALAPTTFTQAKDPLTLNELQSVWAIYGAIVGDTEQVQTVTLG